jgi:SAM-dependent methyltransferase
MRPAKLRPVDPKTLNQIVREWDALASERRSQIDEGLDLSLDGVVVPGLLRLASPVEGRVLDVGCGVGATTQALVSGASQVLGIDPSSESINIARLNNRDDRIRYLTASVEELAEECPRPFDLIIASMTLMDVPNLESAIEAVSGLMHDGARGVFSITHPWFWPEYWEYSDLDWFNYGSEIFIEAEFSISRAHSKHVTTHIHRPLEVYVETFGRHGLEIRTIREPMPDPETMRRYPSPWRFPRFLLGAFTRR